MKKLIAFLMALTMITAMTTALASAPSAEDVEYVTVIGEGDIWIVWINDPNPGDDGSSPVNVAVQAQQSGSALDALPQEIRDQLPEGFTVVNEIRGMKLEGALDKLEELAELKAVIKFETPYAEGEEVYLAIGIPGEEGNEWVLLKGVANAENNVEVTFDHDTLMKIGTNEFAVMAISKK